MENVQFTDEPGPKPGGGERVKLVLAILFVIVASVIFSFALKRYLEKSDELKDFRQEQALLETKEELIERKN
jgi:hypothetical protein